MKKISYIAIAALALVACEPEFENSLSDAQAEYSAGDVDFSTYVAIGDSYSAGYADGTIYLHGQENSFPAILAGQFAQVGGGDFTQPLVNDNIGGLSSNGTQIASFPPRLILNSNSAPTPVDGVSTTDIGNVLTGSFNNIGVPGAKSFHASFAGYGSLNPWYGRFASSPTASMFGDALAQNPSFFTLWLGGNDVLAYATSGGVGVDQNAAGNTNPLTYGFNDITHAGVLQQSIQGMIDVLTAGGTNTTKGVLCNVPSVTDIPFFTTVPYAPLDPTSESFGPQIPTLNAQFAALNQVFAALGYPERSIEFSATAASAVVIKDESLFDLTAQISGALQMGGLDQATANLYGMLYGQARQANSSDLLLLTSQSVIGTVDTDAVAMLMGLGLSQEQAGQLAVGGITYPLENQWVLTSTEQMAISTAKTQYNAIIAGIANANPNVVLADMDEALGRLKSVGISYNGGTLSSSYVTGGAFSLDGVHATGQGYAAISNIIIDAVNNGFNANIPTVNPGFYSSIFFE